MTNDENDKKFTCPICGDEEDTYAALELHLRVDHGVTDD